MGNVVVDIAGYLTPQTTVVGSLCTMSPFASVFRNLCVVDK
jgi:hypothetical protein